MKEKRLVRYEDDRMFLGVAAGLARYLNVDPVLIRLFFAIVILSSFGQGILLYFLLAVLMPVERAEAKANGFDEEEIVVHEAA